MLELIVSDLDGTLFNTQKAISLENQQAIHYAISQGIPFVVATGRHIKETKSIFSSAHLTCPLLAVNGSAIYDEEGTLLQTFPIAVSHVLEILEKVKNYPDLYAEVITEEAILSDRLAVRLAMFKESIQLHDPNSSEFEKEQTLQRRLREFPCQPVENLSTYLKEHETTSVLKVLIINLSEERQILQDCKQTLQSIDGIRITSSYYKNLEINAINAHKGAAVLAYAQKNNIDPKNILAIGDNFNDVTMIELAGYGTAMGNAEEAVKKIAKHITGTNDENGVAQAIYHFINQERNEIHGKKEH